MRFRRAEKAPPSYRLGRRPRPLCRKILGMSMHFSRDPPSSDAQSEYLPLPRLRGSHASAIQPSISAQPSAPPMAQPTQPSKPSQVTPPKPEGPSAPMKSSESVQMSRNCFSARTPCQVGRGESRIRQVANERNDCAASSFRFAQASGKGCDVRGSATQEAALPATLIGLSVSRCRGSWVFPVATHSAASGPPEVAATKTATVLHSGESAGGQAA